MEFTIDCSCGAQHRVTAVEAGRTRRCRCGNDISIPRLSELRRSVGEQPYLVGIADKLRRMSAEQELPLGPICMECGRQTSNALPCRVECERPYAKGPGFWSTLLTHVVLPFSMLMGAWREYSNPEVHGRESIVETPLRLCPDCAAKVRKSKRRIRELLLRVPPYADLLQEHPNAGIHVSSNSPAATT